MVTYSVSALCSTVTSAHTAALWIGPVRARKLNISLWKKTHLKKSNCCLQDDADHWMKPRYNEAHLQGLIQLESPAYRWKILCRISFFPLIYPVLLRKVSLKHRSQIESESRLHFFLIMFDSQSDLIAIRAKLTAVATSSYRVTLAILALSADAGEREREEGEMKSEPCGSSLEIVGTYQKTRGCPRTYSRSVCIGHLIKQAEPLPGRAWSSGCVSSAAACLITEEEEEDCTQWCHQLTCKVTQCIYRGPALHVVHKDRVV